MNEPEPIADPSIADDNPNTIARQTHTRILGRIPCMNPVDLDVIQRGLTGFREILDAML